MTQAMPRKSLEPYLFDTVTYYNHQVEGIRTLARLRSFLLADDMGLGKSLQALTVFVMDVIQKKGDSAIVVCPVSLKGNWADEIEKFTSISHIVFGQGTDSRGRNKKLGPNERSLQLVEFAGLPGPKILITNYEQVVAHKDELNGLGFHIAIFDEAHAMKNYKSKRSKACRGLKANRSFLLTGTPILNQVNDLWPLLNRIDPGQFPAYWQFVNRYCRYGGYMNKAIVGPKNERELREKIRPVMLRRLKRDVLDLPEVQLIQKRVDLSPEQQKLYDEAEEEMRITLQGGLDELEIENALVKFIYLKQICGTTFNFTGDDSSYKLDVLTEDNDQLLQNGERTVIFTQFRSVHKCIVKRLEDRKYHPYILTGDTPHAERSNIVAQWGHDSSAQPMVAMLQVAGVGLNMTQARHGFFADKLFVPGLNQQAIDRLHRIGASTTQPIQIIEYLCRNTIENRIEQILNVKNKIFKDIIESASNSSEWKRKLVAAVAEQMK